MDYLLAALLGLVQGLTEFLPVSSSGHLILFPALFGFEDQGLAMDAILHLATLLAIIIFFRTDLGLLIQGLYDPKVDRNYRRLAWSIILASFPAGIAGLLWGHWIETHLRSATFVAGNLLFWSMVFWIADRFSRNRTTVSDELETMKPGQVFFIGVAQALALVPGTSRSGVTIAAGLFTRLSQATAARFSFLLGAPIILAAGLLKALDLATSPEPHLIYTPGQMAIAFAMAFASGYLSIKLLLKIVARVGLLPFILYRVALGLFILWMF